ncbi:velvet factor-domain-containing protein [Phycomyces blakesleeanus]|uniref:Velvet factor-domain-containing protein n=1 Tax=Phycomyces blakesleeanus TaxID=4837 RepID=A0ABR3AVY9_PHYBL
MSISNERERRPIEPAPILQLQWPKCSIDGTRINLQSPFYFMIVSLINATDPTNSLLPSHDYFSGSTVSSLHQLKDVDNTTGGFFVFGDLAVKQEGRYKLQFNLFEIVNNKALSRFITVSDVFTVYSARSFGSPERSTFLSRIFSDQGIKLRIYKERRLKTVSKQKLDYFRETQIDKLKLVSQWSRATRDTFDRYSNISNDVYFGRWQSVLLNPAKSSRSNTWSTKRSKECSITENNSADRAPKTNITMHSIVLPPQPTEVSLMSTPQFSISPTETCSSLEQPKDCFQPYISPMLLNTADTQTPDQYLPSLQHILEKPYMSSSLVLPAPFSANPLPLAHCFGFVENFSR